MKPKWCCGLHRVMAVSYWAVKSIEILASVHSSTYGHRLVLRYLSICPHLGQKKKKFIHCHCAQTTLLIWNISQWVCYKLQNLQLADTFISLSVRSICFCLCTLSLCQVNFHSLSLSLCHARSHLISPPHFVFYVFLPSRFFSSTPRAALFLICGYPSAFAVYLRLSVSFALPSPHISLCSQFLHRG